MYLNDKGDNIKIKFLILLMMFTILISGCNSSKQLECPTCPEMPVDQVDNYSHEILDDYQALNVIKEGIDIKLVGSLMVN